MQDIKTELVLIDSCDHICHHLLSCRIQPVSDHQLCPLQYSYLFNFNPFPIAWLGKQQKYQLKA